MRKVALRGLFARKLRLVLTALAVALGRHADRRDVRLHGHDQQLVRQDLHPVGEGHRRVDHAAQDDRHVEQRRHAADGLAGDPRAGPPAAGRAERRRLGLRRRHRARQERQAHRHGRRPELHRLDRRPAALQRVHGQAGAQAAARPTRSRSTPRRPTSKDFKLGDKIAVVATAPRKDYTIVGIDADRRRRLLRRRDGRRHARCPRRSACSARRGFDQIQVVGQARRLARAAARPAAHARCRRR